MENTSQTALLPDEDFPVQMQTITLCFAMAATTSEVIPKFHNLFTSEIN